MSEFRTVVGFEDVWRPPVRPARPHPKAVLGGARAEARARLVRIAARVPEVMVKVTGRTRDPTHLAAHLAYITRNGALHAMGRDDLPIVGRREIADLAQDWSAACLSDSRRRTNSPFSVAIILSMPAGTDAIRLRDAATTFAQATFAGSFDYVLVLHTDVSHPHAHLTVRALGDRGERLNPKKADLEAWRQGFARALRALGVEAEATPRRARGVTLKSERAAVRRLRERHLHEQATMSRVQRGAYAAAAASVFGDDRSYRPWEIKTATRQAQVRRLYLAQARLLQASDDVADRALGRAVEDFVGGMPRADSARLALARQLREANRRLELERRSPTDASQRERRR